MIFHNILWFGASPPTVSRFEGEAFHFQQLSLDISLEHLEFLGPVAAVVLEYERTQLHYPVLLRRLRQCYPQAPLLVLAGQHTTEEVLQALRTVATDCLRQPLDATALLSILKRYIEVKVTIKGNKIQSFLIDLGHKIVAMLQEMQTLHFLPQPMLGARSTMAKASTGIEVRFFGNFEWWVNGKISPEKLSRREKALLAYFLFYPGKKIHRDHLMTLFWPESLAESAKNSLHVAIAGIRRYLERTPIAADCLMHQEQLYSFVPIVSLRTDVGLFLQHMQKARQFEQAGNTESALYSYFCAFGVYRDDLLTDLTDVDWVRDQRECLREKYIMVLKTLGENFFRHQQYDFAGQLFRKILETDDCYEPAHRYLMQCYQITGNCHKAILQYQKCREVLMKKFNVKPSSETTRLYESIYRQEICM
jgi:DNA-binding SARP family transcriptional activator